MNDFTWERMLEELFPDFAGELEVLSAHPSKHWFKFHYKAPGSRWIYLGGKRRFYIFDDSHPEDYISGEAVLEMLKNDKSRHRLEAL